MSCLKNPFAVLLGKLPPWIKYVIDNCPFIFSLRTRIFTFRVLNLERTRASFNVMDRNMEYVPYFDQSMVVFNTLLSFKIRKKNILTELIKRNNIWISCTGKTPADNEYLGPIKYYPSYQGFPGYYYSYMNSEDYLSPLVTIKFKRPKSGLVINIECRAWAKNIKYDRHDRSGSVHFELLID